MALMRLKTSMLGAGLIGCAALAPAQAQVQPSTQQVEITGTSPLPGQGISWDVLPYNTQVVRRGAPDAAQADDAGEHVDFSLPGYALLNLRAAWKPESVKDLELFARVSNVTNRRYASFGAIAETVFDANGGDESDALFVAPGAPRAFTVGARWSF